MTVVVTPSRGTGAARLGRTEIPKTLCFSLQENNRLRLP